MSQLLLTVQAKKIHYKDVSITGVANTRVITDVLESSQNRTYRILAVTPTEVTSTEQNDAVLEAWLESEQVMETSVQHGLTTFDSATREWNTEIPLLMDVPPGMTFKLATTSGSTLSTFKFRVAYTIQQEQ